MFGRGCWIEKYGGWSEPAGWTADPYGGEVGAPKKLCAVDGALGALDSSNGLSSVIGEPAPPMPMPDRGEIGGGSHTCGGDVGGGGGGC